MICPGDVKHTKRANTSICLPSTVSLAGSFAGRGGGVALESFFLHTAGHYEAHTWLKFYSYKPFFCHWTLTDSLLQRLPGSDRRETDPCSYLYHGTDVFTSLYVKKKTKKDTQVAEFSPQQPVDPYIPCMALLDLFFCFFCVRRKLDMSKKTKKKIRGAKTARSGERKRRHAWKGIHHHHGYLVDIYNNQDTRRAGSSKVQA